jgi:hypothetical protein
LGETLGIAKPLGLKTSSPNLRFPMSLAGSNESRPIRVPADEKKKAARLIILRENPLTQRHLSRTALSVATKG